MKSALLLLLAFSIPAFAAEASPTQHWYERVSLSSEHPSQTLLLLYVDGARLIVNGNEFLVDLVDRSPDSVALKITKNGEVLCSGLEPNCFLKKGEDNDAFLRMTGARISWVPPAAGDSGNGALLLFELPGPSCVKIYGSAPEETGLNIAFVSDGFQKGEEADFKAAALQVVRDLLSVSPYSKHASAVNAYYVPASIGKSYDFYSPTALLAAGNDARECRKTLTVVLSKFFWESERAMAVAAYDGIRLPYPLYASSRSSDYALEGRHIAAHEFGHALAGLGDEFFFEDGFKSAVNGEPDYSPNTDSLGCGKWCSGANAAGAKCNELYAAFSQCQGKGAACVDGVTAKQGAAALTALQACDFGSDCVGGTGCYAGAEKSFITMFKPVKSGCVMGDLYLTTTFCPVCAHALEEKLKEYG